MDYGSSEMQKLNVISSVSWRGWRGWRGEGGTGGGEREGREEGRWGGRVEENQNSGGRSLKTFSDFLSSSLLEYGR